MKNLPLWAWWAWGMLLIAFAVWILSAFPSPNR